MEGLPLLDRVERETKCKFELGVFFRRRLHLRNVSRLSRRLAP